MKKTTKTKTTPIKEDLFQLLKGLKDHRRAQGKRHPLPFILMITLMSIMSGAKSERAIVRFAQNNKRELVDLLHIERAEVPSKSVISGFVQNADFKKLEDLFHKWSMQFVVIEKDEWISVDGKAIRGTLVNANDKMQDFISLVTVFMSKKKQILSVGKINTKKENELPAVRHLIEMLDLQGAIFTLDALHCQKDTVNTIVSSQNDYVIGVKDNQRKLHAQLKKMPRLKTMSTSMSSRKEAGGGKKKEQ